MSNEHDAGAAYLASLKRSSSQGAGSAPADAPEERPPSTIEADDGGVNIRRSPIVEKRRSPRYRCQGSARLQEIGAGTTMWATLADISMHGCYIEAATPFNAGTILSLRLEANGFRIEATGEVRVSYPGVGMGICFNKISEGDRERLRELVHSISKPAMILNSRVATHSLSVPPPDSWRAVANPAAALQAIFTFFEKRHIMGREEFIRILRNSQGSGT
jgi:hypothetical protein